MSFDQVSRALSDGADPDMLCITCPWDRFCITPPSMTKAEVDAKIAEAQKADEERAKQVKASGSKAGIPMGMLITAVTIGGKGTAATVCPVLAMRLRMAEGRNIVDLVKAYMQDPARRTDQS